MSFVIQTTKPRNPLVALARQRVAGAHGPNNSARRQADRRALAREIARVDADRRSP